MKSALIIDDDITSRNLFGDMLRKVSFVVEEAEDGWDGIKLAKKNYYDVILLDLKMPGLDGEQVLNILSKLSKKQPTLVVSGYLTKDRIMKLSKIGARGFLAKPIEEMKFYNAVYQLCPFDIPGK
ncbi:MAG: response regulator [bacterium]|nr:response regulator [bacterium]